MRKPPAPLALLVALVVVAGCGGESRTEQAAGPPQSTPSSPTSPTPTPPSAPPSTPTVSTEAPTRPYVLRRRLHVGGQVLPGRFYGVTARGDAWVALSVQGSTSWGVGTTAHRLPHGERGWLSTDGRYLLTASRWDACGGDGRHSCVIRLWDTSGEEATRRLVMHRTVEVVGVTDRGVVMLTEGASLRWDELLWDAAGGAHTVQSLEDSPPMTEWAMQGWEPAGFGLAGFQFSAGNVPGQWLGEIVDGQLRPRLRLPDNTEPGPGGRWVLGNPWMQTPAAQFPGPRTTRTLSAWRLERPGKPVRLRAPRGWFFAEAAASGSPVFWEGADTFLALVLDARKGGDRLARCDIPLATCVTVAD